MNSTFLDGVHGHESARAFLWRCVSSDRVPHALLFEGPEGVGKRTVAIALARHLVCGDDAEEGSRFDSRAHDRFVLYQDLLRPLSVVRRTLIPLTGSEEALRTDYELLESEEWIEGVSPRTGEGVVDRIARNPEKFTGRKGIPFAAVLEKELTGLASSKKCTATAVEVARRLFSSGTSRAEYRRNLGIELINGKGDGTYFRTVSSLLARTAGDAWRVAVLDDAHRMTEAAENAFLKTLEEPPPRTLLVLVTSQASALLDTTLSRCARVRFNALEEGTVASFLTKTQGVSAAEAPLLASLSEGSIGRGLALRDTDFTAQRDFAASLIPRVASGDLAACLSLSGAHLSRGDAGDTSLDSQREKTRALLEVLALCFRDLTLADCGIAAVSRAGLDDELLREVARRRTAEEWERLFRATERAVSDVEASVDPRLALEGLFVDALPPPPPGAAR